MTEIKLNKEKSKLFLSVYGKIKNTVINKIKLENFKLTDTSQYHNNNSCFRVLSVLDKKQIEIYYDYNRINLVNIKIIKTGEQFKNIKEEDIESIINKITNKDSIFSHTKYETTTNYGYTPFLIVNQKKYLLDYTYEECNEIIAGDFDIENFITEINKAI